ncbi:MAG: helix-turn-helix domain-containing protein [Lachnospiraceae bacterium]|nr:helix-turn-helix domain-containing protein [Lachnospiraceae bacterium]
MSVYESIMTGLTEAVEDANAKDKKLKRRVVTIEPIKEYSAKEVKQIRNSTGLSQKLFAGYMGVSNKTVEAWEAGTNQPSGAASRLLSMLEMDSELINKFPFVKI